MSDEPLPPIPNPIRSHGGYDQLESSPLDWRLDEYETLLAYRRVILTVRSTARNIASDQYGFTAALISLFIWPGRFFGSMGIGLILSWSVRLKNNLHVNPTLTVRATKNNHPCVRRADCVCTPSLGHSAPGAFQMPSRSPHWHL